MGGLRESWAPGGDVVFFKDLMPGYADAARTGSRIRPTTPGTRLKETRVRVKTTMPTA